MSVSTYLEMYLTLFGWRMYAEFWQILLDTGVAYLPFIGMFLRNIVEPVKSQEAKDASSTSLRRIEIDLAVMFTVIVLGVQPMITIQYTGMNYTKACTGKTVKAGNSGTTYDATFTTSTLGGSSAKIPVWWYAVLAVTGGFNDAAIMAIPCSTDIRLLETKLSNARVKDPHLRRQVRLFYNDCYNEAMTSFLDNNMSYPKNKPLDDLYWLGSEYFLNNLYDKNRASTEIPGFRYDKDRDLEYDPRIYIPVDGKPTCKQWWTGEGHVNKIGLRDALAGQIDSDILTDFKTAVSKLTGKSKQEAENTTIKTLISREESHFNGLRDLSTYNDAGFANAMNSAAATAGAILESAQFYPAMYMMKAAAPIIQSVVLMLIYMLMPFYFLFSSYNIGKMMFMSIILFSVKFWTVLWAIAHWLDNHLIEALEPSWYRLDLVQNNMVVELVINFVTAGMFVVVPLFWSGLLGWAGFKVGSEMNKAGSELRGASESAGKQGGNAAKSSITKGKY